jgi:hypothetical protein
MGSSTFRRIVASFRDGRYTAFSIDWAWAMTWRGMGV